MLSNTYNFISLDRLKYKPSEKIKQIKIINNHKIIQDSHIVVILIGTLLEGVP
jgi:hypothetical protein